MNPVARAAEIAAELARRAERNKIKQYFPDSGKFARHLYPKHMEFFALGASKPYRLFVGANGVGKTEGCGGYETTLHLTGLYPDWWEGKRFSRPITAWIAGEDNPTLRGSLQVKMFGQPGRMGTGLIPGELIGKPSYKSNTNGVLDRIMVKHVSGGHSLAYVKSYKEGRESFQAADVDWIWLDEEPKPEIFSECVQRFRGETAEGGLILTFTPLEGISDVVSMFMPEYAQDYDEAEYEASGRAFVTCSWEDIPHMTEEEKARKLANCLPHERDARSKGIPSLGSGKIYPVEESKIFIDPIRLAPHWPRVYGLDVGWNKTAALWAAWDQDTDTVYLYSEHYMGEAVPAIHAAAIKARGSWIPGVIDPAARGRNQKDGSRLIQDYRDLGLNLKPADNTVSSGLLEGLTRMETGRLKVFNTLTNFRTEFRLYRRDEKGHVVKQRDHLMDVMRYIINSGLKIAALPTSNVITIPQVRFG